MAALPKGGQPKSGMTRQDDGSYLFNLPARKPRTKVVGGTRAELLAWLREKPRTWADVHWRLRRPDGNIFKEATVLLMLSVTLGYGIRTNAEGYIEVLEPKKR